MDKKNRHIEQLTPELIQAYHSGTLTSTEMHQVEILMLENPLYDEGIEGLESLSAEEFDLDIDELSARVDQATQEEKIGFWTTWKKAAAVILVLITASGLFYFNQPTDLPTKELSEVKKPLEKVAADSTSGDDDTQTEKFEDTPESTQPVKELTQKALASTAVKPNKVAKTDKDVEEVTLTPILDIKAKGLETLPAPKTLALSKPILDKKNDSLQETLQLRGEAELKNVQTSITTESAKRKLSNTGLRSSLLAASTAADSSINSVYGIVVGSDDGLPLPQVTVLEKGTIKGKATNLNGEFNFDSLKPSTTLVFSYLGYITQEIQVGTKQELSVKMVPDATSLAEFVVTGVAAATPAQKLPFTITTVEGGAIDGSRAKTNVASTQSSTKAKPIDGFPKFRRYLKKNLIYPDAAKAEKVKGTVVVEFYISSTGELSDFIIIKSLGAGCDEEAIRLIKEGPKWNPKTVDADKTPVSSVVTVKVRFRP